MVWYLRLMLLSILIPGHVTVRLHKLFQFIDGFKSEHDLKGFLHVGNDYSIFLHLPKPHDRNLIYELYETKHVGDIKTSKPQLMAVTKVPVSFMKEQLKNFLYELYKSKYEDDSVVPGITLKSLREWQIDKSLKTVNNQDGIVIPDKPSVLRNVL